MISFWLFLFLQNIPIITQLCYRCNVSSESRKFCFQLDIREHLTSTSFQHALKFSVNISYRTFYQKGCPNKNIDRKMLPIYLNLLKIGKTRTWRKRWFTRSFWWFNSLLIESNLRYWCVNLLWFWIFCFFVLCNCFHLSFYVVWFFRNDCEIKISLTFGASSFTSWK